MATDGGWWMGSFEELPPEHQDAYLNRPRLLNALVRLHSLDPGGCSFMFSLPGTSTLPDMIAEGHDLAELADRLAESIRFAVSDGINILVLEVAEESGEGLTASPGPFGDVEPPPALVVDIKLGCFGRRGAEVGLWMPDPHEFLQAMESGASLESVMRSAEATIHRRVAPALRAEIFEGDLFS